MPGGTATPWTAPAPATSPASTSSTPPDELGTRVSHGAAFAVTPASSAAVWPDVAAATATLRAADAVFALTRAEADRLRSHGACADRVLVVGQAADAPLPVDTAVLQERLGLHGRVVLHLGRRERFKGARELLAAAPEVWSAIPDTSFVFAGPTAGAAIPDGPRLRDLGMVDETTKHGLLALCDVLCVPSRADVFPLVFLEA